MLSLLLSVSATDPGTFVAVPVLLRLVALADCDTLRTVTVRADPVTAFRAEWTLQWPLLERREANPRLNRRRVVL